MAADPTRLKEYECFKNLTDEQLEAVAQFASEGQFQSGHTFFEEGNKANQIFLLSAGEVEVLYSIGEEGPSRVDKVQSGEIIGCSALIEPYIYTSTTRSLTEVEVMVIEAVALRQLMVEDCSLGFSIQKDLIRMLLDRIIDLRLGV